MQSNEQLIKDAKEKLGKSFDALFSNQIVESGLLLHDAMMVSENVDDDELTISCMNVLGRLYIISGHEQKAIESFLDAISYALSHHYYKVLPQFYNAVGTQYHIAGNDANAVKYFLEAEGALNYDECKKHSQYHIWSALTYINLATAYCLQKDCERAAYYLEKVKPFFEYKDVSAFRFEYFVTEAMICWQMGDKGRVYENIDKLIAELEQITAPDLDYIQGIYEICELLLEMKEYERFEKVVSYFADFVNQLDSMYYQIKLSDVWSKWHLATQSFSDHRIVIKDYEDFNKRHFFHGNDTGSSYIDKKSALYKTLVKTMSTVEELNINMGIGYIAIEGSEEWKKELEQEKGEVLLRETEKIFDDVIGNKGKILKNDENKYIAIFMSVEKDILENVALEIRNRIVAGGQNYPAVSQGYVLFNEVSGRHMDDVIVQAQKANRKAKEAEGNYFVSVL